MKIIFDDSLLGDQASKDFFISCLMAHRECHTLDLSNVPEILNKTQGDKNFTEVLKHLTKNSANKKFYYKIRVALKKTHTKPDEINTTILIGDLNKVLSRKAIIILENEHSDLKFVKNVLFSQGKTNILKELNISWEVRGAGGCGDIPKLIDSETARSLGINRIIVIHDSDKLHPDTNPAEIQQKIISKSNEHNISCHTLQKREIENYIPDLKISSLDHARKEMISQFKRLSSEQKDFFDYKFGFKKKNGYKNKDDPCFNNLYATLDDKAYDALKDGFGKDIGETVFGNPDHITFDDFAQRCDKINDEFIEICEAIQRIL